MLIKCRILDCSGKLSWQIFLVLFCPWMWQKISMVHWECFGFIFPLPSLTLSIFPFCSPEWLTVWVDSSRLLRVCLSIPAMKTSLQVCVDGPFVLVHIWWEGVPTFASWVVPNTQVSSQATFKPVDGFFFFIPCFLFHVQFSFCTFSAFHSFSPTSLTLILPLALQDLCFCYRLVFFSPRTLLYQHLLAQYISY